MRLPLWLLLLALLLIAADAPVDKPVPEKLMPPKGQVVLFKLKAKGVQIYECKAKGDQFEWVFKAPQADLLDDGKKVGKHYAGPIWESNDGSKVVGKLLEKAGAPKETDIPWLLLKASAIEEKGVLGNVEYIQRLDTQGGIPSAKADKSQEGKTVRIDYQATYVFFGKTK